MNQLKKIILILIVFLLSVPFNAKSDEKAYTCDFKKGKHGYVLKANIKTKADSDCILDVLYNPTHLTKFVKNASIEIIEMGDDWYDVKYSYKRLFYDTSSIFKKTMISDKKKVVFEMTDYKNNGLQMPKVLKSTGYYQINKVDDVFNVEYYQECQIEDHILNEPYVFLAEQEAKQFIRDLNDYLNVQCKKKAHK